MLVGGIGSNVFGWPGLVVGSAGQAFRLLLTELDRFPRAANRKQRGAAGEVGGRGNAARAPFTFSRWRFVKVVLTHNFSNSTGKHADLAPCGGEPFPCDASGCCRRAGPGAWHRLTGAAERCRVRRR